MIKLPNLDALRFVLATLVLLYHVPQLCKNQGLPFFDGLPIFHRGVEAVYMFFCLSGFLIIRLIYLAKQRGAFSMRNFYMRRILRIFPLYYLVLIFGFLFYHWIVPQLGISFETNYNLTEGLLLTVFFLPNVFAELYDPGGILAVLWSIGIEEQFYLFIAPMLLFIKPGRILSVLIGIAVLYFVVFHLPFTELLREYFFVYFFLLFGGITALLEEKGHLQFLKSHPAIPLAIGIITLLFFVTDLFVFEILWVRNGITVVVFCLFLHALAYNNFEITVRNRFVNYLGKISYGLYMYHVIALNFVVFIFLKLKDYENFTDEITIVLINITTFVLTVAMAHLSYRYFERFFLKLKTNYRK
ncbi:MAG: hypothetical protein CMC70_11940 [Flavobacteriaceae bacterium]|nr:hypothetical protein [Flavobacteriaceae bacterium]